MNKISKGIYLDNLNKIIFKFNDVGEDLLKDKNKIFLDFIYQNTIKIGSQNILKKYFLTSPNYATKAEFIISNNCNMRCKYCYSFEERNNKKIKYEKAVAVIDRLINNAILKNCITGRDKKIYLYFHGGGEPSCEFELLKKIVDYAKMATSRNKTELHLEISTNLSLKDKEILDFYVENDFFVHISMDGIEKIQNYQRPYANGSPSFGVVKKNIDYISQKNISFSIRLTITDFSVNYTVESVKFLKSMYPNVCFIKLAPLECTSESQLNHMNPPTHQAYLKSLSSLEKIEWDTRSLYYSVFGEKNSLINSGMCASTRFEQLIISPEGIISTCHEDQSEKYSYGIIDENGIIHINENKVDEMKSDDYKNIMEGLCSKCSIRSLCMGGCKHRRHSQNKELFCCIEKYITIKHIKNLVNNIEKYDLKNKIFNLKINDNVAYIQMIFLE